MTKKDLLLDYNIQFFAEGEGDEGAEAPEVAEPGVEEDSPDEPTYGNQPDENAVYAEARRRAEAAANSRVSRQQEAIDRRVASMFGDYKNPITGEPIRNMNDYLDAIEAQERQKANQQMQQAGVDPALIDRMIANNPVVRQAQEAINQASSISAQQQIEADFKEIMSLDPAINSAQDIFALPNFPDMVNYCQRTGASVVDAYKVMNFDRLMQTRSNAATQAAINSAKSKGHMANVGGIVNEDGSMDIPAGELSKWKEWYPDKSAKELKSLYNRAMKARGE